MSLAALAPALDRLCDAGWVARRGGWYERIAVRAHPVSVR
jgi:hypothetical protein